MSKIGIIAGSGLYEMKGLTMKSMKSVSTPYGKPSEQYMTGKAGRHTVIFLPRHGKHHEIPPHMVNYRANIWGFKKLGVERILSIGAVGGIRKSLTPGDIIILDQILDMTRNRKSTYYDGKSGVVHIDFTEPYCPELRRTFFKSGEQTNITLKKTGAYVAVEGPRLETASEIKSFGILGGDVVGMTGMPEASLARELEICYSGIVVVANYAAGIKKKKLTVSEVMGAMQASTDKLKQLIGKTLTLIPEKRNCSCKDSLKEAKI